MTEKFKAFHHKDKSQELLRILRRRKMLIFGTTFLGFSFTALFLQNIKPMYTAKAQIIFENKDTTFIKTQRERLHSPTVAQSVILDLGLMTDPAFNTKIRSSKNSTSFKTINPYETKLHDLSDDIIAKELEPIIARFRKKFSANLVPDSYILNLQYSSYSPQKSVSILNKITEHYLKSLTPEVSSQTNPHELQILERLKENVIIALNNLEDFKLKPKSLAPPKHSTEIYEIAKAKLAEAEKKLRPYMDENGSIVSSNKGLETLNSKEVHKLKSKHRALKEELRTLSTRYGPKHPKIIALSSKISTIRDQINQERKHIISSYQSEYDQALAQLQVLEKPTNNTTMHRDSIAQEKFNMLKNHAEESIRIYSEYETVYNESQKALRNEPLPVQILSQASAPGIPSFPNKSKILGLGTFISFIFGVILTLFIEKTRNTFLSGRQLEEILNLPCYALIPRAIKDKNKPLANYVIDHPSSSISEAVRALRLTLKLRADADKQDGKVITITSSFPNEGKTTLSSWIGCLAAKSGERVILIDADLRRPSIHLSFGQKNTLSLVEYLGGKNKLEEIINTNDPSGLHIIYGRSVPNSALDLISSDKMDQLIRSLRKAYDLIIIDSPACMAVSDTRALERISDQLLYAVLWNKTSREIVHNGVAQFTQFGNTQVATVLTNIDLKKHVQFGYGDIINYYGRYKEYAAP